MSRTQAMRKIAPHTNLISQIAGYKRIVWPAFFLQYVSYIFDITTKCRVYLT
ncbi:hypothetical protein GCM10007183_09200 [Staphylococcus muscae]|uniref:Uncharacterized protein n=1 Tax=Staphylococcus muscae TaxID=1294 RepID=A0ABQ1HRH6_9STAP|nr:hypothetical protein GCM10007183_09200 [Staphylococcus muscae]